MSTSLPDLEVEERPNVDYGSREIAEANEILRTTVGSGLHGIDIPGTDDNDEMGIYIQPPTPVLGVVLIEEARGEYVYRSQPEGVRSGPGDTDLTIYTLRKYLGLAVVGNPTVLLPMWAPEDKILVITPLGEELRSIRSAFFSRHAVNRFLKYMEAQHERMMGGGRKSRVPFRPELIEKYGWDVKYGSHALRLAFQGYQVATEGQLTLPMPEGDRQKVLAVKRGEVPRESVSEVITKAAVLIECLIATDKLAVPPEPDYATINEFAVNAHLSHWQEKGLV